MSPAQALDVARWYPSLAERVRRYVAAVDDAALSEGFRAYLRGDGGTSGWSAQERELLASPVADRPDGATTRGHHSELLHIARSGVDLSGEIEAAEERARSYEATATSGPAPSDPSPEEWSAFAELFASSSSSSSSAAPAPSLTPAHVAALGGLALAALLVLRELL